MAVDILKNIYKDIYNAPRQSDVSIDNKIKQYRHKLGRGSNVAKKGIILIDPINLMPINAVPSKKSEGKYKLFNKLSSEKNSKINYFDLFKPKISPKKKKSVVKPVVKKEPKPCPKGSERNPKTGRCKKIVIKKKKQIKN